MGLKKSGGSGKVGTHRKSESLIEFTSPRTVSEKNYIAPNVGGCSKILHKCDFENEEHDLYFYNPKVSKSERNAGCDELEEKLSASSEFSPNHLEKALNGEDGNPYGRWKPLKNNHPTLKPIALNEKILKLFKTPNDDKIVYPFAGSGSEVIGGIKAGFNNWVGCEINPEYVEIAKARINYWTTQNKQVSLFDRIEKESERK